jgi:SAM-dependent methyltransferase
MSGPDDFAQVSAALTAKLNLLQGLLANVQNRADNSEILVKQCLGVLHGVAASLPQIQAAAAKAGAAASGSANDIRLAALETAALGAPPPEQAGGPPQPRPGADDWRTQLAAFSPRRFETWIKLYEAALPFYEESVEASCSTWNNKYAVAFRDYVRIFARGHVLDVGSGVLPCPVYLEGYPPELLQGLDPRAAASAASFPIAAGVNEFLPFEDASFQTVCNATSLDHVIDLERALDESARVLCEGGRLLLWYAHIPDAPPPPREPGPEEAAEIAPLDQFHLFHLNDDWFLPMLEGRFRIMDRRVYTVGGFSHVFAAYEKRPG